MKNLPNLTENQDYVYIRGVLQEISKAVVPLLKGARPQGQSLDLRSAWFTDCDWSGVNLYAADIDNIDLRAADLRGADLGGITSFNNAFLYGTPWWEAKRISSQLLEYLIQKSPYDNKILYGTKYVHVSQQDYQDKISRLRNEK